MARGYAAEPKQRRLCLRRQVRPAFSSVDGGGLRLVTLKTKDCGGDHRHRTCASDLARLETMPEVENYPWIAMAWILAVYCGLWL